jgi:flagellar biosynthetic protein FlhB
MPDYSGDKSQEPTPHRRQKAREEGSVARSQDLGSAVLLLMGLGVLWACGTSLVEFLAAYGRRQLGGEAWVSADASFASAHCSGMLWELARHMLPILGLILVGAVVVNLGQIGFFFLPAKLGLDVSRIDPLAGLRRMFSLDNVVRLAFALLKLAIIGGVACVCLYQDFPRILELGGLRISEIAASVWQLVFWTGMKIGLALLVLAVLDYGYQYWRHEQDLRMTPQEVREEMRNLEGDPQITARRRAVQKQLVAGRLSHTVPKADVVVTNPTELAVAIQYDPDKMAAPIVLAKGAGLLAQQIRRLALEHGIPILERKPLAQALYREVQLNHPIPHDKYAAVAEVLAYVYHLKGKKITPPRAA